MADPRLEGVVFDKVEFDTLAKQLHERPVQNYFPWIRDGKLVATIDRIVLEKVLDECPSDVTNIPLKKIAERYVNAAPIIVRPDLQFCRMQDYMVNMGHQMVCVVSQNGEYIGSVVRENLLHMSNTYGKRE